MREYREDGLNRVDTITHFLEENMKEGDRVLPLDVVGGAVSAMFRTRARLAGLFQYDFFFYHHCENPFIRKLRRRFVETFDRDKPAFIIRFRERWTPSGPGTCETFEELEERLTRDYELALAHEGFLILKRIRLGKAGSGS